MAQKRKKRRVYDQARNTRSSRSSGSRTGRSGYQEQTLSLEAGASQADRQPRRRQDNSIEFPTQQARSRAQGSGQRRRQSGQAMGTDTRSYPSQGRNTIAYQNTGARSGQGQTVRRERITQGGQRLRPTRATLQSPARREKRKQRRVTRAELRRRRLMRRLTAFVLLLCVIAAGIYLTMTMLFKINSIQVQLTDGTVVSEAGGYSSEEILRALGVELDENIFSFDPSAKAAALEKQFPMLEQIEVVRKYPTSVVVRVVEATPTWVLQTKSGWLTISATLKILDKDSAQPSLPTLYGGEPVSTTPGNQLAFVDVAAASSKESAGSADAESDSASAAGEATDPLTDSRLEALNTLLSALSSRGLLADVTRIEFADTEQIAFLYQDRISVLLGTLNELDYKMDFAQYLLLNTDGKGCAATDTGELDCSHVRSDGTLQPILAQGTPTLPSGYVVSETAQQEQDAADETAQTGDTAEAEDTAADEAGNAQEAVVQPETAEAE